MIFGRAVNIFRYDNRLIVIFDNPLKPRGKIDGVAYHCVVNFILKAKVADNALAAIQAYIRTKHDLGQGNV